MLLHGWEILIADGTDGADKEQPFSVTVTMSPSISTTSFGKKRHSILPVNGSLNASIRLTAYDCSDNIGANGFAAAILAFRKM
jgi:hypothetical protein